MTNFQSPRESYLKSQWSPYPALSKKVLTVSEFLKKFAELSGSTSPTNSLEFQLAGRISKTSSQWKSHLTNANSQASIHKDKTLEASTYEGSSHKAKNLEDTTYYFTIESDGVSLELLFSKDCVLDHFTPKNHALESHVSDSFVSDDYTTDGYATGGLTSNSAPSFYEVLESGDHVLIEGFWNEVQVEGFDVQVKSIKAHQIKLLSPSRESYFIENFNLKKSKQWQFFLQSIRKVFQVLDFTEVQTPTLLPAPGTEPFLDFFKTHLEMGKDTRTFYLPTSPELHLKKMITAGWTKIYEIKKCFRNGEISIHHQPEFWMLEWYRAYAPFDSLIKDIQGIFNYLKLHWPEPIQGYGPIEVTTISELFKKYCNFELTPQTTLDELKKLSTQLEIRMDSSDTWNDIFFRIFLEKIENEIGKTNPIIVKNFPPSQAALARINKEGWADRFELYWKGLEIANAFHELNDPEEQLRRFQSEIAQRKELKGEDIPMDEEFIRALRAGFPPTAGIALGLDRLFMALTDTYDISRTRAFYLQNLNKL